MKRQAERPLRDNTRKTDLMDYDHASLHLTMLIFFFRKTETLLLNPNYATMTTKFFSFVDRPDWLFLNLFDTNNMSIYSTDEVLLQKPNCLDSEINY